MSVTTRLNELEARTPKVAVMYAGSAAPDRSGALPSGVTAGQFVITNLTAPTTGTPVLSELIAQPFDLSGSLKIDQALIEVTTLGAGNTYRVGFYQDDGTGNRPGNLLLDCGTVATDTTGVKVFTAAVTLPQGRIWIVTASQGGAAAVVRTATEPEVTVPTPAVTATAPDWLAATGVAGAFPATAPALTTVRNVAPRVYLRAA